MNGIINTNKHASSNPGWRYQLALLLAGIPVLAYTLWQSIVLRQSRYLKQRLGFGFSVQANNPIWLHAASVGEVLAAEPLLKALRERHPQRTLIITTMTPTGADMVELRIIQTLAASTHCYLPFDWQSATERFMNTIKPCCALIMETELWPNLYHACTQHDIPIVIVNGRISHRTLNSRPWIKQLYHSTLQNVSAVLARSGADADAYLQLGAAPDRTKTIGNIKYGAAKPLTDIKPITLSRPFILAASTHDKEELHIAQQWLQLRTTNTSLQHLLVIAPRHPKRSAEIIKQLGTLNTTLAIRSKGDTITDDTAIYLADTLGELTGFMASAELIIMGGSFESIGGHNVLEPAMLGKVIIFGPHMHNFADEAAGLLEQKAAIQAQDYSDLLTFIPDLLNNSPKRLAYGERAQLFMQGNRDIVQRYVHEIETHCPITDS